MSPSAPGRPRQFVQPVGTAAGGGTGGRMRGGQRGEGRGVEGLLSPHPLEDRPAGRGGRVRGGSPPAALASRTAESASLRLLSPAAAPWSQPLIAIATSDRPAGEASSPTRSKVASRSSEEKESSRWISSIDPRRFRGHVGLEASGPLPQARPRSPRPVPACPDRRRGPPGPPPGVRRRHHPPGKTSSRLMARRSWPHRGRGRGSRRAAAGPRAGRVSFSLRGELPSVREVVEHAVERRAGLVEAFRLHQQPDHPQPVVGVVAGRPAWRSPARGRPAGSRWWPSACRAAAAVPSERLRSASSGA